MRTALAAGGLFFAACAPGASLPGGGGTGDPPLTCGFEIANVSFESFELVESVPAHVLDGGLRAGESRRVEVPCAPSCYVVRAIRAASGREQGPAGWSQVVARPRPTRWVRVELGAPDPFARDVGMWQLAREAGCG